MLIRTFNPTDRRFSSVVGSDDGNWVWAFVLVRDDGGTRLISRNRIGLSGASAGTRAAMRYLMEPGSLVMERKMLLGTRDGAESRVTPSQ